MIKIAIALAWLGAIYGIMGLLIAFLIKFGIL